MKPKSLNKTRKPLSDQQNISKSGVLNELIGIMLKVNLKSSQGKANIYSFDDNNGSRIYL